MLKPTTKFLGLYDDLKPMPEAITFRTDNLLKRALDPNDSSVTMTTHGEIILMPGVMLEQVEELKIDSFGAELKLKPFAGVPFVTVPREKLQDLVDSIHEMFDSDGSDLGDFADKLGDKGAKAMSCMYDALDMATYDNDPNVNTLTEYTSGTGETGNTMLHRNLGIRTIG